jgi:hypothetical protein
MCGYGEYIALEKRYNGFIPRFQRRADSARVSSGTVTMEFVISFPLLVVLMLGIFQFTHIWVARQVVHYGAYCAARAGLVTVCREGGVPGAKSNWPRWQNLAYLGLKNEFCQNGSIGSSRQNGHAGYARTEAEFAGNKAAAKVCAWMVMDGNGNSTNLNLNIPGWGYVPGSDAAERKTRAVVEETGDWNIRATVEHDFALITPIVGPIIAWGMNPWTNANPWQVTTKDITGNVHESYDSVLYPHVRLTETVWLPKPYHTIISAGLTASTGSVSVTQSSSASGGQSPQPKDFVITGLMAGKTVIGVKVTLNYESYGIPDGFEIIYGGNVIGGTGGLVSGNGTIIRTASGSDSTVTIRVTSPRGGTAWNFSVKVEFLYETYD